MKELIKEFDPNDLPKGFEKVTFAPPEESGLELTSFHIFMDATEGEAKKRVDQIIQKQTEEFEEMQRLIEEANAYSLEHDKHRY